MKKTEKKKNQLSVKFRQHLVKFQHKTSRKLEKEDRIAKFGSERNCLLLCFDKADNEPSEVCEKVVRQLDGLS